YIEDVWAGRESRAAAVAHERDGLSVRGEVYGQLRFRTEAGDNLIGGNRQSIQQMAVGRDVVQEDGRRYAKVAVGRAVVEDGRIRGIGSWRGAGDRYRRRAPGDERNVDRSRHAARRQYRDTGYQQRGSASIDAAAEHQRIGLEFKIAGASLVLIAIGEGTDSGEGNDDPQCNCDEDEIFLQVCLLRGSQNHTTPRRAG